MQDVANESTDNSLGFPLHQAIVKGLTKKLNVTSFFPIQKRVFSIITETSYSSEFTLDDFKHDLLVKAATGSGKTLAYAIPIAQSLVLRAVPKIRALILVPTRDLGNQVADVFQQLVYFTDLVVAKIVGLESMEAESDVMEYADVVVATPGRIAAHIQQKPNLLSYLKLIVLDEADKLLAPNFQEWLNVIFTSSKTTESSVKTSRSTKFISGHPQLHRKHVHKFLVSATLFYDPLTLVPLHLEATATVTDTGISMDFLSALNGEKQLDGKGNTVESNRELLEQMATSFKNDAEQYHLPETMSQCVFVCPYEVPKEVALIKAIEKVDGFSKNIICFTSSSKQEAVISNFLKMYAQKMEKNQKRIYTHHKLTAFVRNGGILVATDSTSRGIDANVDIIINFNMPPTPSSYVHRAGRTARAGKQGMCITLLKRSEKQQFFRDVVRFITGGFRTPDSDKMQESSIEKQITDDIAMETDDKRKIDSAKENKKDKKKEEKDNAKESTEEKEETSFDTTGSSDDESSAETSSEESADDNEKKRDSEEHSEEDVEMDEAMSATEKNEDSEEETISKEKAEEIEDEEIGEDEEDIDDAIKESEELRNNANKEMKKNRLQINEIIFLSLKTIGAEMIATVKELETAAKETADSFKKGKSAKAKKRIREGQEK